MRKRTAGWVWLCIALLLAVSTVGETEIRYGRVGITQRASDLRVVDQVRIEGSGTSARVVRN